MMASDFNRETIESKLGGVFEVARFFPNLDGIAPPEL